MVAKALATKLGGEYLGIGDIVENEKLCSGFDEDRNSIVADVRRVSRRIKKLVHDSTKTIIIEGHYAPDVIPAELVSSVFVLRRDPEKIKEVFEARGYNKKKISENMEAEMLDVCLTHAINKYGVEQVDEIDVTKMTVSEVVEEILLVLEGQRSPKVGIVDWFSELERKGRLDLMLSFLNDN